MQQDNNNKTTTWDKDIKPEVQTCPSCDQVKCICDQMNKVIERITQTPDISGKGGYGKSNR